MFSDPRCNNGAKVATAFVYSQLELGRTEAEIVIYFIEVMLPQLFSTADRVQTPVG